MNLRIIPCLDILNGQVVKGVKFNNLEFLGNSVELFQKYQDQGADEIVLLDIGATNQNHQPFLGLLSEITHKKRIAVVAGGGIRTERQAQLLFDCGADKVSLNSICFRKLDLVQNLAKRYGSQAVVGAVDYRYIEGKRFCVYRSGSETLHIDPLDHIARLYNAGCGEILLTCFDRDGTKEGFDLKFLKMVCEKLPLPVIASGGAGEISHLVDLPQLGVTGALIAGKIHRNEWAIPWLKTKLNENQIQVRL